MAENEPIRENDQREEAFEASRTDRDATLAAVHRLEASAGSASPGREEGWLSQVLEDLGTLEEAITNERSESLQPDSLLSMIARDYPRRFGARVRQLRTQLDDVLQQVVSLKDQLDAVERGEADSADVRERLGWLVRALHHRRARETDLVFEAIDMDLGRRAGG
jgi:hypothetical protein